MLATGLEDNVVITGANHGIGAAAARAFAAQGARLFVAYFGDPALGTSSRGPIRV